MGMCKSTKTVWGVRWEALGPNDPEDVVSMASQEEAEKAVREGDRPGFVVWRSYVTEWGVTK